ncbi:hypothetical protein DY251_20960 [Mesorhizobium denitrificans]|uniref:Uncharacterized protein n=1 Tax=Mesorhizobium denitrificans TaxID=2294114 RepID=A0A371X1Z3_9HYPH|nr:hypothetical protein DY251_20960 [Mesorhizobium denitrificans]
MLHDAERPVRESCGAAMASVANDGNGPDSTRSSTMIATRLPLSRWLIRVSTMPIATGDRATI